MFENIHVFGQEMQIESQTTQFQHEIVYSNGYYL